MCPDFVPYDEELYNMGAKQGFLHSKLCDLIAEWGLSLSNVELYEIVAELGYFNANISKEDYEERKRVWVEVHNYCETKKIPFDVFCFWLLNRLKYNKTPESKMIIQKIKRTLKQKEFDDLVNKDFDVPTYDEWLAWKADWNEDDEEGDGDMFFYSDPGLYSDCADWKDDWDGPKY